jgi:omega-hydroxy-beta-dihydromenaquinone-9 sulfotransferase
LSIGFEAMVGKPVGVSTATSKEHSRKTTSGEFHRYPLHSPRFWHGMPSFVFWRMMYRNRFAVALNRLHIAASVSFFSPMTDVVSLLQHAVHGRAIGRTQIKDSPLFILGHWRSGTTMLHEMFQEDRRFASPTTYQCFAPWHFLLTQKAMLSVGNFLLPERRPMDNMRAGWQLPQEDEFALMNLGAPSTYLSMAFPNGEPPMMAALTMDDLSEKDLRYWQSCFEWFLKILTYHYNKQLILKSPPHTGRLGLLRKMYPDAKFVHIVRDPRSLFPSTKHLWRALASAQSFQKPCSEETLDAFVIESMHRLYRDFDKNRAGLPDNQFVEVRYEELVKEPVANMERIYTQLELGDFGAIRTNLEKRQQKNKDYRTNKHVFDPDLEAYILEVWGDYAKRFGYV